MTIDDFLRTRTRPDHLETARVKLLHRAFLETIPQGDRVAWARSRFTSELASRGYPVEIVGKTYHAIGLALV